MALASGVQQAIWMFNWLKEVHLPMDGPLEMLCDNLGAVSLTETMKAHNLGKSIDIKYHFVHECIATIMCAALSYRSCTSSEAFPAFHSSSDSFCTSSYSRGQSKPTYIGHMGNWDTCAEKCQLAMYKTVSM